MRKLFLIPTMLLAGLSLSYAQTNTVVSDTTATMASAEQVSQALTLAMITVGVLLLVVIILAMSIQALIQVTLYPEGKPVSASTKLAEPSWWDRFKGLAPAPGRQMDREIGHEYDGIQELDNDMPPWFKYLFYASIVFAAGYILNYHVFKWNPLQAEEYLQELASAEADLALVREKTAQSIDENSVTVLNESSELEKGKSIFIQNCAACHGQKGEGLVGPNLTDENWIHGGGIKNLFKVVKYGVPEKGMISWQSQLNPQQIQEVTSYILTLAGSNPPNAKEAQGEIWIEQDTIIQNTESADTASSKL